MIRSGALALAAFCMTGAHAQTAPAADAQQASEQGEDIVVKGAKLPPKVVHHYVRQVSGTIDGQMSRFDYPICPRVLGFPEDYSKIIADRIRRVAKAVGAPVDREDCRANLVVLVAADADALVKQIRKTMPTYFLGVSSSDMHRALRPGPVHMWNNVVLLNEDNRQAVGGVLTVRSASFIKLPHKQAIAGSTIVLDDDALVGKSLTQIADYVAMRALSGAKPPSEGIEADTIMTLFDPSVATPLSVTAVDKSYLTALYKSDPFDKANAAMGRISGQIGRDARARGVDTGKE